jgi:hypothetical protein
MYNAYGGGERTCDVQDVCNALQSGIKCSTHSDVRDDGEG